MNQLTYEIIISVTIILSIIFISECYGKMNKKIDNMDENKIEKDPEINKKDDFLDNIISSLKLHLNHHN